MSDTTPSRGSGDECDLDECWRKSSHSMSNGHCLEVARLSDGRVAVRDSKAPDAGVLRLTPDVWAAFIEEIRA